jgi:hypothetical protein
MSDRWQQIEELYHAAREDRTVLEKADPELRREVESLLAQEKGAGFLESPALEVAGRQLAAAEGGQDLIGRRIGSYQILSLLGAGGMGEVYRAKDTKLKREVALKILPDAFAHDAARMARFQREAEVLAALNHPNICTLHNLDRQGEIDYLVMEFLEGETLAQRLKRGALPVAEVLEFAIQIASALDAAHAKAVTHRDIKPANIFVVRRGQVKVLDFGLAKLNQPSPGPQSETATMKESLTTAGMVMGTVSYMSPEQARGEEVDARTDLFSFGVMLYEMATSSAPFRGNSTTLILDAILHATPAPVRQLRPELPAALEQIVSTALEKDRDLRYQTASELRAALLRLKRDAQAGAAPGAEAVAAVPSSRITRRTAISALSGAAAGAAATGVFAISRYQGTVPRKLTRFAITLPEGEVDPVFFNKSVAISPQGTHIAFDTIAPPSLSAFYIRALGELQSKRVKEVASSGAPFFSPDGRWIGFLQRSTTALTPPPGLRKMALDGGAPVALSPPCAFAGGTWADDGTIYFVQDVPGGMMRVPAAGGEPNEIVKIDFEKGERQIKYPCALPGGKAVLFTVTSTDNASFDEARIVVFSPETGRKKLLVQGGTHPRYSPSGHLLYAYDGKIFAVRFDLARLAVEGQPLTILEGVLMSRNTGVANYDVSASGDLAYIPGICDEGLRTLVWVDRNGKAKTAPLAARPYLHPRLSPDDSRLAIEIEGPSHDLYVYDFDRGVLANITTDGVSHWPVWSPDGTDLGYRAGPMGKWKLWRVPADRSRPPQQISAPGFSQSAESWSPDGRAIAYTAAAPEVPPKVMVAVLEGGHDQQTVASGAAVEGSPKFSPDGRWLAYCSNESGRPQVYVQAFPGPGPKIQVSNDGGTDPVWKRAGGELFFRNGDTMMAVTVSTTVTFTAGRPQELWKGHYSHGMSSSCGPPGATSSNYDVTADGKRFLMIKDENQDNPISRQIVVVLGWADEVTRRGKA